MKKATPLLVFVVLFTLILLFVYEVFTNPAMAAIQSADNQAMCLGQDAAPLDMLTADHATVMRVILDPNYMGQGVQCVQQARAAGYKIYLTVTYDNQQTPGQDAAWFASQLPQYGPLWAVSVGNEQDLHPGGETPAQYRRVWDAVEPVLPADAIHVFADGSGWDKTWIQDAWDSEGTPPVGVGAVGFHCYNVNNYVLPAIPAFAAWANQQGVPFWCSETTGWLDTPAELASVSPYLGLVNDYYWPKPDPVPGWAQSIPPAASTLAAVTHAVMRTLAVVASHKPSKPRKHKLVRRRRVRVCHKRSRSCVSLGGSLRRSSRSSGGCSTSTCTRRIASISGTGTANAGSNRRG